MGSGRVFAAGCALAALALATAGCGAEESANEPRPQPPTRVSVTVTPSAITVQPPRIAIGPEPTQQIPQNQHASQPQVKSKAPLDVVFVSANLTDFDSKLEVRGPKDVKSGALVANGNGSMLASLPTGVYRVSAADIPGAKPVRFTVGPYRSSSENDLLLP
ncbi:MAG: hypothetical protein QOF13_1336 [Solirubrobacterales bacterium]|jgi:hypothetical protein|nr:hypothetical protein [Solirubrobacterales bacterium]